jgi:hypothetical protein
MRVWIGIDSTALGNIPQHRWIKLPNFVGCIDLFTDYLNVLTLVYSAKFSDAKNVFKHGGGNPLFYALIHKLGRLFGLINW